MGDWRPPTAVIVVLRMSNLRQRKLIYVGYVLRKRESLETEIIQGRVAQFQAQERMDG